MEIYVSVFPSIDPKILLVYTNDDFRYALGIDRFCKIPLPHSESMEKLSI